MSKTYIHYGADEFIPEKVVHDSGKDWGFMMFKPFGLWASPISSDSYTWKEWCEAEDFHVDRLEKSFTFTLTDDARILEVRNPSDIEPYILKIGNGIVKGLDKETLIDNFDGIELHLSDNYNELRYSYFYTWDVDSICIWNPDIIVCEKGEGNGGDAH